MKAIHSLPGRLRLEAPEIYYKPVLAAQVSENLVYLKGFLQAETNHRTGRILIKYAPDQLSTSDVVYQVKAVIKTLQRKEPLPWNRRHKLRQPRQKQNELEVYELESLPVTRQAILTLISGILLSYVSVKGKSTNGTKDLKALDQVNDILTILTGYPIIRTALEHIIKTGEPTAELLATAASLASLTMEEKSWGLFINTVVYLNTLLRTCAAEYSRDKIKTMLGKRQNAARVVTAEGPVILNADNLVSGSTIIIKAGERAPGDGTILKGQAIVQEHPTRGANWMKRVSPGDEIYAGSVLRKGAVFVKVSRAGADTYVGKIIGILHQGTYRCQEVHELSHGLTKKMSIAAFMSAAGVYLKTHDLNRAIQLLIVGSPGAAGFAASMAHGTSVLHAAFHGILTKDDRFIEQMGKADTVLFNKPDYLFFRSSQDKDMFKMLRKGNARRIGILTDGSRIETQAVLQRINPDYCWSECTPEIKSKKIRSLQKRGERVAIVGDMENDIAALATANVGIALQQGDELNLESAGIIVPGENPQLVGWLKLLSSMSCRAAHQNVALTLGMQSLGLILGLMDKLSPFSMLVINNVSTLGILLNSGRLLLPVQPRSWPPKAKEKLLINGAARE